MWQIDDTQPPLGERRERARVVLEQVAVYQERRPHAGEARPAPSRQRRRCGPLRGIKQGVHGPHPWVKQTVDRVYDLFMGPAELLIGVPLGKLRARYGEPFDVEDTVDEGVECVLEQNGKVVVEAADVNAQPRPGRAHIVGQSGLTGRVGAGVHRVLHEFGMEHGQHDVIRREGLCRTQLKVHSRGGRAEFRVRRMPGLHCRPGCEKHGYARRLGFEREVEVFGDVGIWFREFEPRIDVPGQHGWPGPPCRPEDRFDTVAFDVRTRDRDEGVLGCQEPKKPTDQRLVEPRHKVGVAEHVFRRVVGEAFGGVDDRSGGSGLLLEAEAKVGEPGTFAITPRRDAFAADQVDPRVGEVDDLRDMGLAGVGQRHRDLEGRVVVVGYVAPRVQRLDPAPAA